ncbi:MAG TPA: VanZ family protein [Kofleriaceae bacterium]
MSRWIRVALPVYWIALAAATHYPRVRVPDEIPKSDKVLHFSAFAILALLFWLLLAARKRTSATTVWIAALVLIPYASLDEYTQRFVGRDSDYFDWIANLAGITCVLVAAEIHRRVRANAWPDRSRDSPSDSSRR